MSVLPMLLSLIGGGGGKSQSQGANADPNNKPPTVDASNIIAQSVNANQQSGQQTQAAAQQLLQQGMPTQAITIPGAAQAQQAAVPTPAQPQQPQQDKNSSPQGSEGSSSQDQALAETLAKWGFSQQADAQGNQSTHFDPMQFAGHLMGGEKLGNLMSNIGKQLEVPLHNVSDYLAKQGIFGGGSNNSDGSAE